MGIDLSSDRDAFLDRLVAAGRFEDRRQALERAIDLLRDETETLEEIRQGLQSIAQGEGLPLDEAYRQLKEKHRLPDLP